MAETLCCQMVPGKLKFEELRPEARIETRQYRNETTMRSSCERPEDLRRRNLSASFGVSLHRRPSSPLERLGRQTAVEGVLGTGMDHVSGSAHRVSSPRDAQSARLPRV